MNDPNETLKVKEITVMSKTFLDLPSVVADINFQINLSKELSRLSANSTNAQVQINEKRSKLIKEGKISNAHTLRLKRTTYDTFEELGYLGNDKFSEEYILISEKKSKLPSVQRELIIDTCNNAIRKMVVGYSIRLYVGMNFGTKNSSARGYIQDINQEGNTIHIERTTRTLNPDGNMYSTKLEKWDLKKTIESFQSGRYYAKDGSKFIEAGFPPKDIDPNDQPK